MCLFKCIPQVFLVLYNQTMYAMKKVNKAHMLKRNIVRFLVRECEIGFRVLGFMGFRV